MVAFCTSHAHENPGANPQRVPVPSVRAIPLLSLTINDFLVNFILPILLESSHSCVFASFQNDSSRLPSCFAHVVPLLQKVSQSKHWRSCEAIIHHHFIWILSYTFWYPGWQWIRPSWFVRMNDCLKITNMFVTECSFCELWQRL